MRFLSRAVEENQGYALLLIAALVGILAFTFLWPSAWEFPMDDTYIHFVYAQNLAEHGRIMFNGPDEVGVGSTSLTWVLLLAGAYRLGVPFHLAAKAFGLLALTGAGWGLFLLFKPILRPLPALALALLVVSSGHMLWFALSGMETLLFLALGVLALLLYRDRRWAALGAVLGLLALTRPDGLALAAALAVVEGAQAAALFARRGEENPWRSAAARLRGPLLAGLICLLVCAPWFGYLLWRTGHILPTSAVGKQASSLLALRLITERNPALDFINHLTPLIYFGTWAVYLFGFVLGGMALPGPRLPLGAAVGGAAYTISLGGIIAWAVIIVPLLVSFSRGAVCFLRTRRINDPGIRPLVLFAAWLALHNLAYAFFLPIPGTASRYGSINHVALWLILLWGLLRLLRRPAAPRWAAAGLTAGLILVAAANTLYWNRVYDANLEHMRNVRIPAARYVMKFVPPDENIAVFDVGAMRFYSGRQIIDLGGLIDPELGEVFMRDGRIDRYLAERDVRWVILPGRTGTTREGWFDFALEMGLTSSPIFDLRQETVFEIDYQRWLLGYLPTNNYQATVTVYRLLSE